MKKLGLAVGTSAIAALAVGVALSAGGTKTTKVSVTLKEFKVIPSRASVAAGKVTFVVKNIGKLTHEMIVVKTTLAPGKLPMKGAEASEKGSVGEAPNIAPGKTKTVTLTLKKGKYVLLCNIPGHYKAGQYIAFTVK